MTVVETRFGRLEGIRREGDVAFLGIPFAAPPIGERRFRAPEPPASWSGVRQATAWGFACPQSSHAIPGFAASGPQDEDCLYLNVYTPAADGRRRPVMFWIHGGGFTHGTGAELLFDGGPLARRGDVVVVTINYRLGALGYLYLGDHLPGAGLTANAGQLDQIAALQWVRDNIEAFGGDPGNVTIFGESAGAGAVGTLLGMPAASSLFHRAILESGTGRATPPEASAKVTDLLLETLGLDRRRAAELRTIPVAAIIEAQGAVAGRAGGPAFGPVLDGVTIPERPIDAIRRGAAAAVPVLIGTNRDEVKLFAASIRRDPIDEDQLAKSVSSALGNLEDGKARALVEVYRRSRQGRALPATNLDILDAISSDARFRVPAMRLALAQQEHQSNTYMYLFTHASPARHGALGACHALEMPFVFGTLDAPTQDRFAGSGPEVERLSGNMMDSWLSFAKAAAPGHEAIGPWPSYSADGRPTMVLDLVSKLEPDPFSEERRAIEQFV